LHSGVEPHAAPASFLKVWQALPLHACVAGQLLGTALHSPAALHSCFVKVVPEQVLEPHSWSGARSLHALPSALQPSWQALPQLCMQQIPSTHCRPSRHGDGVEQLSPGPLPVTTDWH